MKNILKSFVAVLALVNAASCNLDLYPDTTLPYDENVPMIQTADDVNKYGVSVYANFRALQSGTYAIASDVMFDAFNATQEYGNRFGGIHRLDNSFTSGDEYVEGFWGNNYSVIKNLNVLIAQVPIATVDKAAYGAQLEKIEATAHFVRAYCYLALARHFGNAYNAATAATDLCVPLVLVYDQTARPARNTVAEVYEQIKADLDAAAPVLSKIEGSVAAEDFTADVLNYLYAQYYIDVKDYAKAYECANSIIASEKYALANTAKDLQAEWLSDAGKETLMLLPVSLTELVTGYGEYTNFGSDSNSPSGYSFKSGYIPSKTLMDSYEAADIRRAAWFNTCKTYPFCSSGVYHTEKFYVLYKFFGNSALNASGVPDSHIAPRPFAIADMYLVAAEAACQNNQPDKALAALNALQSARKATPSAAATMEAIQKEWFRETVGEGKRLECLKRWGAACPVREAQAGALAAHVLQEGASYEQRALAANDYHMNWPIPAYEIKVNPNLVQNTGYGAVEVE